MQQLRSPNDVSNENAVERCRRAPDLQIPPAFLFFLSSGRPLRQSTTSAFATRLVVVDARNAVERRSAPCVVSHSLVKLASAGRLGTRSVAWEARLCDLTKLEAAFVGADAADAILVFLVSNVDRPLLGVCGNRRSELSA
ncbi:hypothetical protein AXG93_1881s1400 [Marchantia polymorpha subsp. ruderalis]|uniref:Uncharacterized protein n=1 Tax=Marchantia polymorpha subsp. ruderalis TaxID=1480154 RepID=A0A176W479_MARPO|nr:hypothetical protein AXG93_1881s1400 [Marchantia polymorpha subsp. ruderalis]